MNNKIYLFKKFSYKFEENIMKFTQRGEKESTQKKS